jgi:hypothetical protein
VVACGRSSESENPKQQICEGDSSCAGHRGGPFRSSGDGPVIGLERRGRVVRAGFQVNEATSPADAKAGLLALAADYRTAYPSAMKTIDEHADQLVAHLRFPLEHRKRTRSTNLLERTFVEVRRRTKIIGRCRGETSALSLIWAVLELASRGWRGITMTPKAVAQIERIRRAKTPTLDRSDRLAEQEVVAA